jgi:hypothetical protein
MGVVIETCVKHPGGPTRIRGTDVALRPAPTPLVVPSGSGPLGFPPDPPLPSGPRGVSVPSGLFGVLLIPPRVLRCPWCLLGPLSS